MVLIGLGALPFLIWSFASRAIWPEVFVAAYLLTAFVFLTLMIGYPGPGSRWYWRLVAIMVTIHVVVLSMFALGALTIVTTGIKPPTMMFFGLVISIMTAEAWVALRLIQKFSQKG